MLALAAMKKPCAELEFVWSAVMHSPAWWQDDRRNWCAYCGIPMRIKGLKAGEQPLTARTRDHIVPLGLRGGCLTIPACRACNREKGHMSLQAFLMTDYFKAVRKRKHRNQWPVQDLLLASAAATIRAALRVSEREKAVAKPPRPVSIKPDEDQAGVKLSATPLMQ